MKLREYSYFSDRIWEDEEADYPKPPTPAEIAEKIRWFHAEYAQVKDRFRGWFEELGYKVAVEEVPITMREGYPGEYPSLEYRFMLTGGEKDRVVRLRPMAIWMIGNEATLDMGGRVACWLKICYFRTDSSITVYGAGFGYEKIDEDGWYWDPQRLNNPPHKLSLDTARELLRRI